MLCFLELVKIFRGPQNIELKSNAFLKFIQVIFGFIFLPFEQNQGCNYWFKTIEKWQVIIKNGLILLQS